MRKTKVIMLGFAFLVTGASGQITLKSSKLPRHFGEPILTDTLSTFFIPTQYNDEMFSSNKIAFWESYYANIIVYDFGKDSYKKLFETDTYIKSFYNYNYTAREIGIKNVTPKWVFLLVKNKDSNESGRVDDNDATVLYVTSTTGENLKALTKETENVVSFDVFARQNFALVKIQRDVNGDHSFSSKDDDYYYRKVDLTDLQVGKPIEWK